MNIINALDSKKAFDVYGIPIKIVKIHPLLYPIY